VQARRKNEEKCTEVIVIGDDYIAYVVFLSALKVAHSKACNQSAKFDFAKVKIENSSGNQTQETIAYPRYSFDFDEGRYPAG
jgi:hypothetical protein